MPPMYRPCAIAAALVLTLATHTPVAEATVLLFDQSEPNVGTTNAAPVPQDYGDNVNALSQGGFTYGENGEGFTPNVTVAYDTFSPGGDPGNIHMWTDAYGDLENVIYDEIDGRGRLEVALSAEVGFEVLLHGFDLAGWPTTDYSIDSVEVLDGSDNVLFSQAPVAIQGALDGTAHTDIDFASPIMASLLRIRFDASALGSASDNIGIDNIRFGQQEVGAAPVPEPTTLALIATGLAGLGFRRKAR